MRAQTEKTTFSCKDDCTLTKHTRHWTYSALRYFFWTAHQLNLTCLQNITSRKGNFRTIYGEPIRQFYFPFSLSQVKNQLFIPFQLVLVQTHCFSLKMSKIIAGGVVWAVNWQQR